MNSRFMTKGQKIGIKLKKIILFNHLKKLLDNQIMIN